MWLDALIPRPRLHLVRFHGVLAPNAKLRALVVPQGPAQEQQTAEAAVVECEVEHGQDRPDRISWARLLKRVFDIDMQHFPNCGAGQLKIIAAILERLVIEKTSSTWGWTRSRRSGRGRARRNSFSPAEPRLLRPAASRHTPPQARPAGIGRQHRPDIVCEHAARARPRVQSAKGSGHQGEP